MEITTVYQKERHEFGRDTHHFGFVSSDIVDEFGQDTELKGEHMERNPTILDIQAIPEMSEVYVNTVTVSYRAQGMLHLEGGWPKDVDYTEKEQTQCVIARLPLLKCSLERQQRQRARAALWQQRLRPQHAWQAVAAAERRHGRQAARK